MSKITNDGLTRSGTGCLYSCTHMATVGVKGLRTCCDVVVVYSMSEECATSLSLCMSIYYIRTARSMTSVCLSVCLSAACVLHSAIVSKRLKLWSKFFHCIILILRNWTAFRNSDGVTLTGGGAIPHRESVDKYRSGIKIREFQ